MSHVREGIKGYSPGERAGGVVAVVLAAIFWGLSGVFVRLANLDGLEVAFYRMCVGAVLMSSVVLASGGALSWRLVWRSLPGGVLLAGDIAMFYRAVNLTTVTDASVIGVLQPALVLLVAGPLFGEHVGIRKIGWTALAVLGAAVVVLGSKLTSGSIDGDLLAAGSLLSFTGYWLVSKRARDEVGALQYTAGVMIVGALVLAPVALGTGEAFHRVPPIAWLWIVVLAVVPGAGHLLINWSHRFLEVSVSSVIISGNPIVAAVASLLVLSQPIELLQVLGGLAAIVAIAAVARAPRLPGHDV